MRRLSCLTTFAGLLLLAVGSLLGQRDLPVITVDHGPNSPEVAQRHYVVMVSLDGFRYDYLQKYGATHLLAIGKHGAISPDGMIPAYPSLTFPNHLTLVTGLYPEHHGIVANSFYDPDRKERYSFNDPKTVTDGSWYGGVPLWSLAERQGMRSASFFWPGSEAEIAGERPSYYLKFDDKVDDEMRITQVLDWLKLPDAKRPHFVALYYSDVDHSGHQFGPESPQTKAAVKHVDDLIGKLEAGLEATHLPVDLIIVSDHGMQRVADGWITLDKFVDLTNFETTGGQLYPKSEEDAAKAYQKLKAASADFFVYRRKDVPASLHFDSNPREGDPIVVANGPYAIRLHGPLPGQQDKLPTLGAHGYDPGKIVSMRAIFLAEGPDIKPGVMLQPFENVNVYPFVAHILGLEIGKTDGSLNVLSGALKDSY
jgi:predicted AlkP superfamily pyrophosphatase or phosphodiesterase